MYVMCEHIVTGPGPGSVAYDRRYASLGGVSSESRVNFGAPVLLGVDLRDSGFSSVFGQQID